MILYALVDARDEPGHPLGDAVDVYVRCEDAERDLAGIVGDEPEWEPYMSLVAIRLNAGSRY